MFETLSNTALLSIYNTHAPKAAARFESRKIGESRTFKVLQAKGLTIEDAVALADVEPRVAAFALLPPVPVVELQKSDAEFAAEYVVGKIARVEEDDSDVWAIEIASEKAAYARPSPACEQPEIDTIETMIVAAGLTGKKLMLFRMMLRADGVSESEGCSELAWSGCSATMFRVYQAAEAAGFVMRKWKGEDHKMRYAAAL